jgi:hypothetical protein
MAMYQFNIVIDTAITLAERLLLTAVSGMMRTSGFGGCPCSNLNSRTT